MPATISQTEAQAIAVLRAFLIAMLPPDIEVVRGQTNRVPPPVGPNYVVLTPTLRARLSTNVSTYTDTPGAGTRHALSPMQVTVQIDVHGPAGAENAQIVVTLLRDDAACRAFRDAGMDAQPLYAGDPRQTPFLNGEAQVETRWTLDAVLQVNTAVTVSQQFAEKIGTKLVSVHEARTQGWPVGASGAIRLASAVIGADGQTVTVPPFVQTSPAAVWIIHHSLNRYPDVVVINTSGDEIEPESKHYPDLNNLIVTFGIPTAGTASLI